MPYVYVLSTLPSLIHMYAAMGVLLDWTFPQAQRDSFDWWIDNFIQCYRFGPNSGKFKDILAYLQLLVAIETLLIHLLKLQNFRLFMYYSFVGLYVITQLRHVLYGPGVLAIGYLFTHILIFTILVLYYETRIRKLKL